jgi:hypothetical protein
MGSLTLPRVRVELRPTTTIDPGLAVNFCGELARPRGKGLVGYVGWSAEFVLGVGGWWTEEGWDRMG